MNLSNFDFIKNGGLREKNPALLKYFFTVEYSTIRCQNIIQYNASYFSSICIIRFKNMYLKEWLIWSSTVILSTN